MNWSLFPLLGLCLSLQAQEIQISTLSTNTYTNVLTTLSISKVDKPCPECGGPNHHEQRVEHIETFIVVQATVIAGGQTNRMNVFTGPKVSGVRTNLALIPFPAPRTRSPGWPATNSPPPLP